MRLHPVTGLGFDVHPLVSGRRCVLGSRDPSPKGLLGHSDADVLCHAVSDAVLGALSLGDIGKWFPGDPRFKDARSRISRRIFGRKRERFQKSFT